MLFNLTSVLTACTLISCATLVAVDEDTKRPGRGNSSPFSVANGSSGSPGSGSSGGSDDGGSRPHGFDGERWQDRMPREPMWFINAGSGQRNSTVHPEDNFKGLAVWWRGDRAVERLLNHVRTGYDLGARWFFVNRPMGTPGNTHVPAASWLTMSDEKREELPKKLTQAVLDEFDEPVHIVWFIGSSLSDPRNFAGWSPGLDEQYYELGENNSWEELIGSRVTIGGWLSTGASGIAIDHSSPLDERGHFIDLFESLNGFPFHLMVFGEAYPLEYGSDGNAQRGGHGRLTFDQHAIESMPWLGTTDYLDRNWPLESGSDVFPVDSDLTRMFVWFNRSILFYGNESDRVSRVHAYMDRNQIPITNDPLMFTEAINRLRSSRSSARAPGGGSDGQAGSGNQSSGSPRARSHRASGSGAGSESGSTQSQAGQGSSKANLPKRYTRSKRKQKK